MMYIFIIMSQSDYYNISNKMILMDNRINIHMNNINLSNMINIFIMIGKQNMERYMNDIDQHKDIGCIHMLNCIHYYLIDNNFPNMMYKIFNLNMIYIKLDILYIMMNQLICNILQDSVINRLIRIDIMKWGKISNQNDNLYM